MQRWTTEKDQRAERKRQRDSPKNRQVTQAQQTLESARKNLPEEADEGDLANIEKLRRKQLVAETERIENRVGC